jgi:hypothetical protein
MKIVRQQTARNPVARAVARQKLRAALVDQKIKLYLLDAGETCAEFMEGLGMTMVTIGIACEIQKVDNPDTSALKAGLLACQRLMELDSFNPMQATAIDVALTAAEELNKQLTADSIHEAWLLVRKGKSC